MPLPVIAWEGDGLRNSFRIAVLALTVSPIAGAQLTAADISTNSSSQDRDQAELRELRQEVHELRGEVNELHQQVLAQKPATLPLISALPAASDQKQTVTSVLNEADRHGRFMDFSGMSAGWSEEHGFFLRSDDGNFLMSPFVLFQLRGATTYRDDGKSGGRNDTQSGFEMRRLQLGFDGNLFTPDLTYRIFWQSSELTTGNLSLLMAWFQYRFHDTPWVIGGGQFKDPLDHEQLISDAAQLAADRTFVDDELAGGEAFSRGVTLRYDDGGPFRAEGAVTSGFNVPNESFQQFPTNGANYGLAARGEYKLLGNWKDYSHFTSLGNHGDLLVVGAGVDSTEAGHADFLRHVIDAQYNPGPFGFYAAYLGRYTRGNTAGRDGDTYDPSLRAQASWLFAPNWEAFARYSYVHFDGDEFAAHTATTVSEITLGGTYYFHGQKAKLTLDLAYFPTGTPSADTGNDILADPGHTEVVGRAQFQLYL